MADLALDSVGEEPDDILPFDVGGREALGPGQQLALGDARLVYGEGKRKPEMP